MTKETHRARHDPYRVFHTASCFDEAAILLHQANSRILSGPERTVRLPYLIPGIVCRAFSIELYVKCLILVETGDVPRIHELQKLYARLSLASQGAIARRFEQLVTTNPIYGAMQSNLPGFKTVSLRIDEVLKVVNRAFEQWRYDFENQVCSAYGLGEFATAVRERILELKAMGQ